MRTRTVVAGAGRLRDFKGRSRLGSLLAEMSWGRRMPSMRAVLEARQEAAAVRVEGLEAELERVRKTCSGAG